jgi:hypothetical protein
MDIQDLLKNAGDVRNDVFNLPVLIVPGPANLLEITNNEIHLRLLHSEVKCSAKVPSNLNYNAIP